ncbi:DUF4189 domain-containing protein [Shimia sp.]|uniref:DUF4189 domain-containing protein n=1 Tax=Shimia sp. TaxID=1954381 RepID=UPI003565C172
MKASVLSVGALVLAGALNAGQCGYEQCWGAVGIGPGGAYGWAHSHASEGAAYNAAQRGCRGNCDQIRTFYNTCGAIARASNGGWGWGWASSRQAAENTALGYCREYGANCRVAVWACSP